jgi:hypothetical protein
MLQLDSVLQQIDSRKPQKTFVTGTLGNKGFGAISESTR